MALPPKRAAVAAAVTAATPSLSIDPGLPFAEPTFHGELGSSILLPEFQQVMFVTGFRGVGKTTFSLGVENPQNVIMLDYESKGSGFASQLPGINYFPILEECTDTLGMDYRPIHVWQRTLQVLSALPKNRFTTLIIDNGSYLQEGAGEMVALNPQSWNVKPANAASGQFGGVWPGVRHAIAALFSLVRSKGIKVTVVTFQTKAAWTSAGPSLTKVKTTDVAVWHESSILTIALGSSLPEHAPIPKGLVVKEQLAKLNYNPEIGELVVQRRLPMQLPKATMSEVRRYMAQPADLRNPAPGEIPAMDDVEAWAPTFKREQLAQLTEFLKLANINAEEN